MMFQKWCSCGHWTVPSFFQVCLFPVTSVQMSGAASYTCNLSGIDLVQLSGEQVHILACLSSSKQDIQVISPFRIAAVMSKNGNSLQHSTDKFSPVNANGHDNGTTGENGCQDVDNDMQSVELNSDASPSGHDILETQSLLQMEDHKQQIELMLRRFRESNFFVRIAESDEPLWSKKRATTTKMSDGRSDGQGNSKASRSNIYNTISDKGIFDGSTSGGVARDTVKCYSLQNGDIVVCFEWSFFIAVRHICYNFLYCMTIEYGRCINNCKFYTSS